MVFEPLDPIPLYAQSYAEEACFAALADLHSIMQTIPEARLIGGMMVSLHVNRWHLGNQLARLTADADLGVAPVVIKAGTLLGALSQAGYVQTSGGHYERPITSLSQNKANVPSVAMIDVLVAAYTSRPRLNVRVGDIWTTEVLGLAEALQEPGIKVFVALHGKSGKKITVQLALPSETYALALKAMAWDARMADKDAIDIWHMLNVCHATNTILPSTTLGKKTLSVLHKAFARRDGQAMLAIQKHTSLSPSALRQRWTHIRALLQTIANP